MNTQRPPAALPFFLDAARGKRFCLYHAPAPGRSRVSAILYVPPFGEEMNMSRRMAALQARSFAEAGYGVLQIDLFGCGDSDGELRDADWDIWKEDVVTAIEWLRKHAAPCITLWGLRLGATLVLDVICSEGATASQCILWQPVIAGKTFMTQFLRLTLAGDMTEQRAGISSPRDTLARGEMVEIGGYELSPALVARIDSLDFSLMDDVSTPLHWFELVPDDRMLVPAGRMHIARAWVEHHVDLCLHAVTGSSFWATKEITDCPRLIAETTGLFVEEMA